jgi:hypothetical protein
MSTASPNITNQSVDMEAIRLARRVERENLRTSKFDIVSSFFLALMLFIGVFFVFLFFIWLTSRLSFPPKALAPIVENAAGRGDNAEGFERDFEPPGAEEVEELMEPTLQDTIAAVTDAISSVAATLDTMDTNASASTTGTGSGDSRPPGPEGEGEDIVPRFERWQLEFSAKDMKSYASQLDYYKIELGAIGGGVTGVDYASNLSGSPKARREPDGEKEKRIYFMFTTASPLQKFDQQLLQQAGVKVAGRIQVKFISDDLQNQLAHVELAYAKTKGHTTINTVAKTVFESKPTSGGYAFEVIEQRYRKAK